MRFRTESDQDLVVLKVDFANAFNNISRDAFLHIVDHQLPQISSYMKSCYMSSSVLYFDETQLESKEGVQQGNPWGPLLFCFLLQSLIHKLKSVNIRQWWYLDDGIMIGSRQNVLEALHVMNSFGFGLELNLSKCELFDLFRIKTSLISQLRSLVSMNWIS